MPKKFWKFPAGGDQRVKLKLGLEQKQTGMRGMIVTHLLETTLRFEREKKAGLGLRRRILPVFWHPAAPPPAEYSD
jgi:hypothetical protein